MDIPTFEQYLTLSGRKRLAIRAYQRANNLPLYHARIGVPGPLKGRPNLKNRGPKGTKPHIWRSGPDEQRHYQYQRWHCHRAQAHFRGEEHTITFEDYVEVWGDKWSQRGKLAHSLVLTRKDLEKGWHKDNICLMEKLQHLRRVGELTRLKNL